MSPVPSCPVAAFIMVDWPRVRQVSTALRNQAFALAVSARFAGESAAAGAGLVRLAPAEKTLGANSIR